MSLPSGIQLPEVANATKTITARAIHTATKTVIYGRDYARESADAALFTAAGTWVCAIGIWAGFLLMACVSHRGMRKIDRATARNY
ncbi:unnamed protein product [Clonostachys chloroleuca]|uniref:Uncharacterized protein n=1 Tax=Clonostachys chloroleuca TaxID=1926264 RepID=A0AA35Q7H0_9HYPO|nr:unnamed protein product [Clonostachys chloroleuca]